MPLIDLDSMSHDQLEQEARYWAIEPTDENNDDNKLKKAIEQKRTERASRHPVTEEQIETDMAVKEKPLSKDVKKDVEEGKTVSSVHEATITRPTPYSGKRAGKDEAQETDAQAEQADKDSRKKL